MTRTKTEFKWFTVPQYKLEEEYLRTMHKKGWELSRIGFPGFYHFTECAPADVVYQLDYNLDAAKNKDEYVQMFADFGWEYLFDFVGYSYFKKPVQQMTGHEEIFCDDESRLEMMKRVLKGRIYPLLTIFFALIIPQLFLQTSSSGSSGLQKGLAIFYLIIFFIYLFMFALFGIQYFSFEKKIRKPEKSFRSKYILLSVITLILCAFVISGTMRLWRSSDSKYTVNAQSNQYSVTAEFLNDTLTHELPLTKGEQLALSFVVTDGECYITIYLEEEHPIYEGTVSEASSCTLAVPTTGTYQIVITGNEAMGSFSFQIE